ncbi:MAG: 50S ribosomal protein L11 methyltransferase [bacterium]
MLSDSLRMDGFREAINKMVGRGDVVLDAGTGTGIMAIMAVQAGAEKVYAVEKRGILEVAKNLARENGCADRVHFVGGDVRRIELPERVDGVVCEMLGYSGLSEGIREVMAIAKEKHLKPGGWMIPVETSVFLVPVQDEGLYRKIMLDEEALKVSLESLRDELSHNFWVEGLRDSVFLSEPQITEKIDFRIGDGGGRGVEENEFAIAGGGKLHGLGCWFTAALAPDVILTTAPDNLPTHWSQVFFPLRKPMSVEAGDRLLVRFESFPVGGGEMFYWRVELRDGGGVKGRCVQSNALTFSCLADRKESFPPSLSETFRLK